ncbi:glycine receptor subunit alpha-2-like [Tubulanus polymorphus]|uniref:glycine receptor subunit alpha-2-like n=1 Tax=Tubulanus polymorphus TaxID=672921 RepID=UPI003DA1DC75
MLWHLKTWIFFIISLPGIRVAKLSDYLDRLASSDYHKHSRPFEDAGPVNITLSVFINHFGSFDAINMAYVIDLNLRQSWTDPRLAFDDITEYVDLGYHAAHLIWTPDTCFRNAIKSYAHETPVPNRMIRLMPNGRILYSQRLWLKLYCHMDLRYFPLDQQTCFMAMESFGHTTKDVVFRWKAYKPVVFNSDLELPEFSTNMTTTVRNCEKLYEGIGVHPCRMASFLLTRQYGYYFIQIFTPKILTVMLSWVSFWLDPNASPARISLGLLTVLTISGQSVAIMYRLPNVSYIKVIDVYVSVCLTFVFAAALEFAVVNYLVRQDHARTWKKAIDTSKINNTLMKILKEHTKTNSMTSSEIQSHIENTSEGDRAKKKRTMKIYEKVDVGSRIAFPAIFAIFNFIYWLVAFQIFDY